ncbi:MAG: COG3650 family protein [Roseinatronobacter sp.]
MKYLPLVLALIATAAQGADEPRLYAVTGVEAGDALNVRETPSPSAPVIGTLAPGAVIEVTDRTATRRWGRVNTGEQAGWVSMRFLEAQGRPIDNYNMKVGMRCFGTEPFWSLSYEAGGVTLSQMDTGDTTLTVEIAQDSGIPDDQRRMIRLSGPDGPGVAYVAQGECSDGMSDRRYALSIALMEGPATPLLTGCCTLQPAD